MYKNYWELLDYPFENLPNPAFLYNSSEHDEALTRLVYAIENRKGAAMLTGEIGCGKTTISRLLVQRLVARNYQLALIENPSLEPDEFLREILYQFSIEAPDASKREMVHLLNEHLYRNKNNGVDSVIIVDEAQLIRNEQTYEELRLLLNFQMNDRFLLTLILIGQPDLNERIAKIPQLDQRIAIRYHLKPLEISEMVRFIFHRLKKAGAKRNMFTNDALRRIYEYSAGVPRKVNNICDLSLLVGCGESVYFINQGIVDKSAHSPA
jgi:general secretion pathway protein A